MKKFYSQFLNAFTTGNIGRSKALKILIACTLSSISYSGFAQVVVSPANDTLICSRTAIGGSAPACTTLGTITLTETANSDFASGADQVVLSPPAGWQFCTAATPTVTHGAGDVTSTVIPGGGFTSTSLTINITSGGTALHDVVTITGLQVQALSTGAAAGNMYATSTTGVTGIVTGAGGTSFGKLGLIPAPISSSTGSLPTQLCTNGCVQLTDATPGGVWSSSNPAVATVNPGTGLVCAVAVGGGTVTITYTVAGCPATATFNVVAGPPAITGVHNMCAWYDSIVFISDANTTGLYSSTGVTTYNFSGTGLGKVFANAPSGGTSDSIIYTLPNGCKTVSVLTVNPLPKPFSFPPYSVCAGNSVIIFDSIGCGTWSSSVPAFATLVPIGCDSVQIFGHNPGTTPVFSVITYSLTGTGCKLDTPFTINPVPNPITGPSQICSLATATFGDLTPGGTWSVAPSSVATILPSGLLTGVGPGPAVILYTLPTGCETITSVTVDPLPDSITGPNTVCVGSTINLMDATGGGTWHSTNTHIATIDSMTGVLTGDTAGTVIITYNINPGNCEQQFTVTVQPIPSPIGGPTSVCMGNAISITDTTHGGSWSSAPTSVGTIDATTGTFTGISPGTATVCYTLIATGCQICETVTVNITPGAISGTDTLCVGDSVTLSDGSTGGIWLSHDPTVATIDSFTGVAHGIGAGPDLITYIIGTCPAYYSITVDPFPSMITGKDTLCQGDTTTYHDSLAGGTWSISGVTLGCTIDPSTGFFTATTTNTGTLTIQYTGAGGCSKSFSVTIDSRSPITGPDSVCVGQVITLSDPDADHSGVWSNRHPPIDTFTATNNFPSPFADVIGITAGVDTITYTRGTGCASTFVVTVNPNLPIHGATSECVGDSTLIFDLVTPGTWSIFPGTFATITAGGVVKGIAPGVETIVWTTSHGCTDTLIFTVNPLPGPITGSPTVCQMDSVKLSDTATGGVWSVTNGNASIDTSGYLTGIHVGVDTVYWTYNGTGCKVMYVDTIHALAPITGTDSLCIGDSVMLADADSGGVWSNGATTVGLLSSITVSSTTSTVEYHGISPGADSVYYTMAGTGCRYAYYMRVHGLPDAITGIDSVCVGSTTHLSDDSLGGTWTSKTPGVAIVGSSSGIVTGVSGVAIDTIIYTLPTGCKTTVAVTVDPLPAPISGPPYNVCLGHDTTLTDASPGGVWSTGNAAVAPVTSSGVIHGVSIDTTTITYTLPAGGCPAHLLVTVTPVPVVTTNHPGIKCRYASVQLRADSGMVVNRSYSWTPAYGLSNTTTPNPIASPTITTTYTVIAIDNNTGCDTFATVTVIVDDSLTHLRIVGQDSICDGTCDQLMASGRASSFFDWHPAVGLSCTICDSPKACPDVTTTYWAVAIDDLGCKDSVSFTVTVNPVPVIGVRPNPTILCKRQPLQVEMYTTNTDTTTMKWAWYPNLFLSCDSCRNPILTDTNNIIYNVIGTSIYGCYDSFKVKVSVLDTNVNTVSVDTNICAGTVATLVATSHSLYSNLDVPTFKWLPNYNLSSPDSNWTLAFPNVTTTYSVAIHENACFSDTLPVTVFVQPYPVFNLTPQSPYHTIAGTPVQILTGITNTPIEHYIWRPIQTMECDTCANPIVIPTVTTTYVVKAISIYGCPTTDSVTIIIACDQSQVFVPNTFTPNGDGVNDRFFVSAKGISVINNFAVYSRWGQLLYEAHNIPPNDAAVGWDGTFKGLVLEPDVFVYVLEATCELQPNGPTLKYKGDVSIVK